MAPGDGTQYDIIMIKTDFNYVDYAAGLRKIRNDFHTSRITATRELPGQLAHISNRLHDALRRPPLNQGGR